MKTLERLRWVKVVITQLDAFKIIPILKNTKS